MISWTEEGTGREVCPTCRRRSKEPTVLLLHGKAQVTSAVFEAGRCRVAGGRKRKPRKHQRGGMSPGRRSPDPGSDLSRPPSAAGTRTILLPALHNRVWCVLFVGAVALVDKGVGRREEGRKDGEQRCGRHPFHRWLAFCPACKHPRAAENTVA